MRPRAAPDIEQPAMARQVEQVRPDQRGPDAITMHGPGERAREMGVLLMGLEQVAAPIDLWALVSIACFTPAKDDIAAFLIQRSNTVPK